MGRFISVTRLGLHVARWSNQVKKEVTTKVSRLFLGAVITSCAVEKTPDPGQALTPSPDPPLVEQIKIPYDKKTDDGQGATGGPLWLARATVAKGNYVLKIHASGRGCATANGSRMPIVVFRVDGRRRYSWVIDSHEVDEYRTDLFPLSEGHYDFGLFFVNDYYLHPGCDRDVKLKRVQVVSGDRV